MRNPMVSRVVYSKRVHHLKMIKKVATAIRNEKKNSDKWNKLGKSNSFLEIYFSYSMIMSTTLECGGFYYLLKQISFLMEMFTNCGFIARGGIAIGDLYHKDGIVFGPVLIETINIEQNIAIYPRVMMTSKTLKEGVEIVDGINNLELRREYFKKVLKSYKNEIDEEFFYVDYLSQSEDFDFYKDYIYFLCNTKKIIEDAFIKIKDEHVLEKYKWLKKCLCEELSKRSLNYNDL